MWPVLEKLTWREAQILEYIKGQVRTKGYPPSVREIGRVVGLKSSSTVHSHLGKLEAKGYIRRDPTKPRAIEILDKSELEVKPTINVPVVGRVTAGEPILAQENIEDYFPIPRDFSPYEDQFMLHVKGESMIGAGILDGDYVLVRRQQSASDGDIVVALLGDEATVKRFFKEKDHIRLQPENSTMEPILVKDVQILGRVVGVFRRIH